MNDRVIAVAINYFGADVTERCVKSLLGQVSSFIIVDNSDDSMEFSRLNERLRSLADTVAGFDMTIIDAGDNLGFGRAAQLGIDVAKRADSCAAILLINNDAIACEGMVEGLVECLDRHASPALLAPVSTHGSVPGRLWYHKILGLIMTHPVPGAISYLNGACLLIPYALAKADLFDPDFFMYGEDVLLSWRLVNQGVELVVVEHACYVHAGGWSSRKGGVFYEYHMARAHILLAKKLATSAPERWLFLLGRILGLSARAVARCARFRTLSPVRALVHAWLGQPPGQY